MADPSPEIDFRKRLFVAVHAGAGFHSEAKAAEYKDLCRKACWQAMCLLKKKESAPDAVTAAVTVLEDSELSNAGRGSSLTLTGRVECEAGVMEGDGCLFGAVGCLCGVVNPVQVASRLLHAQQHGSLSLGRVPPSVLVGSGATDWAREQGFSCEDHHKLITDNSKRLYRKYKRKVERAEELSTTNKARRTSDITASGTSESHSAHLNGPLAAASPYLLNSNANMFHTEDFTDSQNEGISTISRTWSPNSGMVQSSHNHGVRSDSQGPMECSSIGEKEGMADSTEDEAKELHMEKAMQDSTEDEAKELHMEKAMQDSTVDEAKELHMEKAMQDSTVDEAKELHMEKVMQDSTVDEAKELHMEKAVNDNTVDEAKELHMEKQVTNSSVAEAEGSYRKAAGGDLDGSEEEPWGSPEEPAAQDTVGAVCVDWQGNVSAAVSSGGIWLKHPGRLGPAAMYGAGCWAQNAGEGLPGVGVITSGCGEHLMRTTLAKSCAECLLSAEDATEGLRTCFKKLFLGSRLLSGVSSRLAGAVAVRMTPMEHSVPDVEVCWGHTTESMALGYLRGDSHRPKTLVSRLSEGSQAGHSFTMSSAFFSHHR